MFHYEKTIFVSVYTLILLNECPHLYFENGIMSSRGRWYLKLYANWVSRDIDLASLLRKPSKKRHVVVENNENLYFWIILHYKLR